MQRYTPTFGWDDFGSTTRAALTFEWSSRGVDGIKVGVYDRRVESEISLLLSLRSPPMSRHFNGQYSPTPLLVVVSWRGTTIFRVFFLGDVRGWAGVVAVCSALAGGVHGCIHAV